MKKLIFSIFIIYLLAEESRAQNVERLCKQVFNDCQACSVFQQECIADNRPQTSQTNKPKPQRPVTSPQNPQPVFPPPPVQKPNCLENGRGCNISEDCCNGNCKVESIGINGQNYAIKVCR